MNIKKKPQIKVGFVPLENKLSKSISYASKNEEEPKFDTSPQLPKMSKEFTGSFDALNLPFNPN